MGAPKQRWTAEEEAALKAGVRKHGAGKWRTILSDPEFGRILKSRSNVDLKDKWRNMGVNANGSGSREKAVTAYKKSKRASKHDDNPLAVSSVAKHFEDEIVDAQPLAVSRESLFTSQKISISRLDSLITEAITSLKEPTGSSKTAITTYIEENYWPLQDFEHLLSLRLKAMLTSGRLMKVHHKYRLAPNMAFSEGKKSKHLFLEGKKSDTSRSVKEEIKTLSKLQVDAELVRLRNMTAEEAAAAAAQAVAEAEAAMTEAEQAAREAEAAEADAEAAQAFAEAAMLTLRNRNREKQMIRV